MEKLNFILAMIGIGIGLFNYLRTRKKNNLIKRHENILKDSEE